jgi:hypothetical protein
VISQVSTPDAEFNGPDEHVLANMRVAAHLPPSTTYQPPFNFNPGVPAHEQTHTSAFFHFNPENRARITRGRTNRRDSHTEGPFVEQVNFKRVLCSVDMDYYRRSSYF